MNYCSLSCGLSRRSYHRFVGEFQIVGQFCVKNVSSSRAQGTTGPSETKLLRKGFIVNSSLDAVEGCETVLPLKDVGHRYLQTYSLHATTRFLSFTNSGCDFL